MKKNKIDMGLIVGNVVAMIISGVITWNIFKYFQNYNPDVIIGFGIIASAIILGALLYRFKCRNRMGYGLVEFTVGIVTVTYAVFALSNTQWGTGVALQILGGLYIIVRAFDNIGEGLKNTHFEMKWKKFFNDEKLLRSIFKKIAKD